MEFKRLKIAQWRGVDDLGSLSCRRDTVLPGWMGSGSVERAFRGEESAW